MGSTFAHRLSASTIVAVLAAMAVLALGRSIDLAAIALVGGIATALLAPRAVSASVAPANEAAARDAGAAELLEAVAEPVLLVRDGRVEIANRAARSLLGAHIVGEDARVAIRHPAAAERLSRPGAGGAPIPLTGIGGTDQHWEMRLGSAADGANVVHLVDTTARHAAERMRVDFVANASHELRTPLASILGFVEALDDAAGEDPALRSRFLHVMGEEARRMQRLVEDLISLSRIEAEKYRAPSTPVDLALLAGGVCTELRRAGGPRGEDLGCDDLAAVPAVAGDEAQLSQLLYNLIGNALKYGPPGTPVRLALTAEGDMVRLTVADRGDGIPPEHLPRLTERFYRVDAGRSRSLGGTGLGLAIVKHIVERHRGRLDIASRVGEGTTVTVTLPVAVDQPPLDLSQKRNG
jgi:two-component system phosphate regulon sensor histidine kinase PhoR